MSLSMCEPLMANRMPIAVTGRVTDGDGGPRRASGALRLSARLMCVPQRPRGRADKTRASARPRASRADVSAL